MNTINADLIKSKILSAVEICKTAGFSIEYGSGYVDITNGRRNRNSACPFLCLLIVANDIHNLPFENYIYNPQKRYHYTDKYIREILKIDDSQQFAIGMGLCAAWHNMDSDVLRGPYEHLGYEIGNTLWKKQNADTEV